MKRRALLALAMCAGLAAKPAAAGGGAPAGFAERVGFEQRLDQRIPFGLGFRDERGERVRLADYLGTSPAALLFAYYGCSNLCPTVIRNLGERLAHASTPGAGSLQVVVVSVNPRDTPAQAAEMKTQYPGNASAQAARWHFLTGGEAEISELARAAGFRYAYDARSGQYAHAAGVVLLTPGGRIAQYLLGFGFTSAQLGQAIEAAAARHIAPAADQLLLLCFHYDPFIGRYGAMALTALRAIAVAALAGFALVLVRRARARRRGDRSPAAAH
jgi:protein SCO1/2